MYVHETCSAQTEPIYIHILAVPLANRQKARTTIEDFALSYLPLHGLGVEAFFKFWDVLCYVEAAIYSMDEENEALAAAGSSSQDLGFTGLHLGVCICLPLRCDALVFNNNNPAWGP